MNRRITFFVATATRTWDGWVVEGEFGLGPLRIGDAFAWVHHRDTGEDEVAGFRVQEVGPTSIRLTSTAEPALRAGDILGGEVPDD